jgi:uncharacterized protein (UPF0179 family)
LRELQDRLDDKEITIRKLQENPESVVKEKIVYVEKAESHTVVESNYKHTESVINKKEVKSEKKSKRSSSSSSSSSSSDSEDKIKELKSKLEHTESEFTLIKLERSNLVEKLSVS